MNGGAIAYTGPALPHLMNDGAKDLYGNDLSVSFQSASWIGELAISKTKSSNILNVISIQSHF